MASISLNALLLFLILSPGFLFLFSFYTMGQLSREDYRYGAVYDIGAIVTIAVFSHIFFGGPYFFLASIFYDFNTFSVLFQRTLIEGKVDAISESFFFCLILWFYPILVCILSFTSGTFLVRAIEAGKYKYLVYLGEQLTHGVIYNAVGLPCSDTPNYVYVSVLTNIMFSGKYVIYSGFAEDITVGPANKIVSVVIINPKRSLIKIKDDTFETASSRYSLEVNETPLISGKHSYLFIPESNILNTLVSAETLEISELKKKA